MNEPTDVPRKPAPLKLARSIWILGFVSMFMDISSEMIHSLLPVFLVTVLGASTVMVGLIEGIGEAAAQLTKLFSGWFSDRVGKRKLFAVIGYALGTASKPLFAIAPTAGWVLVARFTDRVGKGIRGAPRDALVGDVTPPGLRGAAYGLRQSLDTIGALAGPLVAIGLMALLANNFRAVFWIAILPGIAAVVLLVVAVRDPGQPVDRPKVSLRIGDLRRLGGLFWGVVSVGAVLTMARFSEAFLILRAEGAGLSVALVPMVLVVMNAVYGLSAYPIGVLSDRIDRWTLLAVGFGILVAADIALAFAPSLFGIWVGIGLWGLHMGMTQGLLAAFVADAAPAAARAQPSAFSISRAGWRSFWPAS